MVVPPPPFGDQTGHRLVNQPIRHGRIVRQTLRESGIARRDAPRSLPQQDARGNSSFNPGRIAFHTLQNPFDREQDTKGIQVGQLC